VDGGNEGAAVRVDRDSVRVRCGDEIDGASYSTAGHHVERECSRPKTDQCLPVAMKEQTFTNREWQSAGKHSMSFEVVCRQRVFQPQHVDSFEALADEASELGVPGKDGVERRGDAEGRSHGLGRRREPGCLDTAVVAGAPT
jgi:hypothetical protein